MRIRVGIVICSVMIAVAALSSPAVAQQKTVRACQEEWRANKAANQAAGITQKAYVEKCRAGDAAAQQPAAKPATTPTKPMAAKPGTAQKTVRACQEEWRANKEANQAAGITQKAYVEKCRAGTVAAKPATTPSQAPARAAPAARTATPAARAPATVGQPSGARQFATESQAKARCPRDTVVWANLDSKIYHFAGYSDYGNTKKGAYMCERDTTAEGFRAAKNEKHP